MSDPNVAVRVEGLRDLQQELRRIDKALPRELRITHREVAGVILASAQQRAQQLGGLFARAARSVFAGGDNRDAFLRLRPSKRAPFVLGAEFGAKHNIKRTVRTPTPGRVTQRLGWHQLPEWRGNQHIAASGGKPGFFVYPAIREEGTRVVELYERRLMQLLTRAFPD